MSIICSDEDGHEISRKRYGLLGALTNFKAANWEAAIARVRLFRDDHHKQLFIDALYKLQQATDELLAAMEQGNE